PLSAISEQYPHIGRSAPRLPGAGRKRGRPGEQSTAAAGGRAAPRAPRAADRPALHAAGFTYPLLTLRESALANNIAAMAAYCDRAGVALAPHGKTAM